MNNSEELQMAQIENLQTVDATRHRRAITGTFRCGSATCHSAIVKSRNAP